MFDNTPSVPNLLAHFLNMGINTMVLTTRIDHITCVIEIKCINHFGTEEGELIIIKTRKKGAIKRDKIKNR